MGYIPSRIFYKLLVLSALLMPNNLRACICMGGRDAEVNLKDHSVVFIGILTQIVHSDSLYSVYGGSSTVQPYYNFKVLKYCKGLYEDVDFVSVFPDISSSCIGGLKYVAIGDTVLLFPMSLGELSPVFLNVNQCTPYTILTNRVLENPYLKPNESELKLIKDTTVWHYPTFNNTAHKNGVKKPTQYDWRLIALVISAILNLLFLVRTIRGKNASVSNFQP